MNTKLAKALKENTVSMEEFSRDFTPEQEKIVADEISEYDMLLNNARN